MRVEIRFSELGRAAAIKALAWLDAGDHDGYNEPKFDMAEWRDVTPCGALCCIGGYMDITSKRTSGDNPNDYFDAADNNRHRMHKALFYADYERCLETVTVEEAAQQLRNALDHGYVDWIE